MALTQLHAGLSNTAVLFVGVIGVWALLLRIRSRPLNPSWYGAAVVGEIVLVLQGLLGTLLYFQGLDVMLARPFMHILYGIVAVVTLPASYSYFGHLEDDRVKTLAMAVTCFFLWGILLRASNVAQYQLPPL
ncbi:MAG: hypothetical protein DCC57_11525 [Chloroflexi bacterium]|nr:MAG: hypothetical protein DCC57_11525 [Chloroflexota bacterium]